MARFTLLLRIAVTAVILLGCATAVIAQEDAFGRNVTAVTFRTDAPFDVASLDRFVTVTPGQPLAIRDVQRSIKALFATGDFRDVRVEAEVSGLDVSVEFVLSLNYRIDEITIEGIGRNRARATRELRIRNGGVLSLNAVDRSAVAVQEMLSRRGYLEATVDPEVEFIRAENRANVIFHVTMGPLARIGEVRFEGDIAPFTHAELLGAMERTPGSTYRIADSRRDVERIEAFLARRDHRSADVRFLRHEYDAETDLATVFYRVVAGPRVRLEVDGVPRDEVRRWLPLRGSETYTEDEVDRAAERIVEEYQRRGYFFAAVDVAERRDRDELVVTLKIRKGEQHRLDEVLFEGNEEISDRRLRQVVSTAPAGGFRRLLASLFRRNIGITQEQLDEDVTALESFYATEGFTEARIERPVPRPGPEGTLDVVFPIVEGPRTRIATVVIEGAEQVADNRLPRPSVRVGEPYNPQLIAADVLRLKTFYGDRGNVEVQVAPRIEFSDDRTAADVSYRITEGPVIHVGEVVVRGNTYTDDDVVLRKAGLETGEPFTYRTILGAQRELYRLGIFQRVDVLHERAGTSLSERNVAIQVEEGRNLTLSGAVNWSTESKFGVSVSASHRNLFGKARYAGISARYSELEELYSLTYREPFIFNFDVPVQITTFKSSETRRSGDSDATIDRLGTYVEASRVIRERSRWSLRYEYRLVECVEGETCNAATGIFPIPGFPIEDQETRISSVTPSVFWDTRDDAINPTRGFFASASVEYAAPLLSAEADFLKTFLQGAWHRRLSRRTQLAMSVRTGLIEPGGPIESDGSGTFTTPVPYSERFLAGGERTHRAFDLNQLGIPGETLLRNEDGELVAVGGNALVLVNAEYRFPIFGSLAGSVFVDGGNVWSEIGDIDTGDFRYGAGAGLRYLTPVGPIRFDVGWKLDREPEEDPYALFLTLGYAF